MPPRAKPPATLRGTPPVARRADHACGPSAACCRPAASSTSPTIKRSKRCSTKSASNQQEVTDQLGYQVRRAVEVLIHSLDRADQDFGRELLAGVRGRGSLRVGPHGHDAAGVPVLCRGTGTDPQQAVPGLRTELLRLHDQQATAGTGRPARRRIARTPLRRLAPAPGGVPGGVRRAASTTTFTSRPTAAISSIPTASRSSKVASREPRGETPRRTRCRSTIARCCTCSKRCNCCKSRCRVAGQRKLVGSASGHSTSNRSATSTKGLLDHTAKRATEPFLGLAGTRDKEPEIPLAELEKLLAKGRSRSRQVPEGRNGQVGERRSRSRSRPNSMTKMRPGFARPAKVTMRCGSG